MKTTLEPEDIKAIASEVAQLIRPMLTGNGKADKYMTTKELAEYMGLAYSTIANNKKYLPHTFLNSTPLFKQSEIDAYLQQFSVKPKSNNKNQKFIKLFNDKRYDDN